MVFDVLFLDPDTQKTVHHASSLLIADDAKDAREKFFRDYPVAEAVGVTKNWLIRIHEHTFRSPETVH